MSIRRKLLYNADFEERSVYTNSESCNIRLSDRKEINLIPNKSFGRILQPIIIDIFRRIRIRSLDDTSLFFVRYVSVPRGTKDTLRAETPSGQLIVV